MNQKISSLLSPKNGIYFLCLLLFAGLTALLKAYYLAAGEAALTLLLFLYSRHTEARRRKGAQRWLERLADNVDQAARDTTLNCPIPVAVFQPDTDDMVWTNEKFLAMTGAPEHVFDTKLSAAVPNFPTRWLLEGKTECPEEITVGPRRYRVYGHLAPAKDGGDPPATTYWVDVTDLSRAKEAYLNTRPVVALLVLDNYDEVLKPMSDSARSALLSEINNRMDAWTADTGGLFCRVDRDRYIYVFEERYLQDYVDAKFSILDDVRQAPCAEGGPVTLSIGLGRGADTFGELYHYASLSVEMALSRGGDQAVVRNKVGFEFYGGHTKELEKRTKVKSRVMANALRSLVADSNAVMVMGHKMADMDAVGAAAGVCALCRKLNVPCYIINETGAIPGRVIADRLGAQEYYKTRFVDPQEALVAANSGTLLVVVDTNRPDQVISPELLEACTKVAVIDHHRRAAEYIEGAALNFHEPFASSACELVTELLQYQLDSADLFRVEAEALLGGIMLDTKNFTMRTGGRTFEAAAFLRRAGADTAEVKKLFQTDLNGTIAKYDLIRNATLYREGLALAYADHSVGRVTASQAADELLNISGIDCSFVVYPGENGVTMISARSNGNVNVQVVLEALGGGGNAAVAGAQLPGCTIDAVVGMLKTAIDRYFEEN